MRALAIGSHLGPYAIVRKIGVGGMGVVYEGRQPDGGAVALKLLHDACRNDPRSRRRFDDEAVAGCIVRHPNLASTIGHGETEDGVPFLVMQHVAGDPLGVQIQRDGTPSLRQGVQIVQQLLNALHAMHAAGIVHGDVKSDNVLVQRRADGSPSATLIDFGLAHAQFARDRCAQEDLVSGTPEYMPPEVIRGEGSRRASDLYSVGIILYELIAGTTPFVGGSPAEIMRRHIEDDVVPPSLRRDAPVPPLLERIVLRALEKTPELRFPSASAFAAALSVALPLLDDAMLPPANGFSRDAPTCEWTRRSLPRLARGTNR
jgi:serine/threonine protein kinase